MKRDTTELAVDSDCWAIVDNKTISNYIDGDVETYVLISDTWKKKSTIPEPVPVAGTTTCYTREEIVALPSSYEVIEPIYHLMAMVSALVIFYFAYRIMIRPFFRVKL